MSLGLSIEKLVPGGDGLARYEGKVVLVSGVLPGEEVQVEISEDKKHYLRATLKSISKSSSSRVEPKCSIYQLCGGCNWQHMDYPAQLEQKKEIIMDAFLRTGKAQLPDFEIVPSIPWGYRNRAQFQIDRSNKKFGFMRRKSIDIVELESCPILTEPLNLALKNKGELMASGSDSKMPLFSWGENNLARGNQEIEIRLLNKKILFNNSCFFQSNISLLENFISHITEGLQGKSAVDLYSGVGLFALFLADNFKELCLVEENSISMEYAKKNLKKQNAQFFPMSVERFFSQHYLNKPDIAIVDPPRNGISQAAKKALLEAGPGKIIYVSCNPVTQARDYKDIIAAGYRMDSFKAFDFYPQTAHIETVQKFSRKSGMP